MKRRGKRVLSALLLVIVGGALPLAGSPAQATAGDLLCIGTEVETYSPGILMTPRLVTVTATRIYSGCTSTSHPEVTSTVNTVTAQATKSCLDIAKPSTGSFSITWNTGDTSTFTFNRSVTIVTGTTVIIRTGTIASGLFAGDTGLMTSILIGNPTACLGEPGVLSAGGVSTFTLA